MRDHPAGPVTRDRLGRGPLQHTGVPHMRLRIRLVPIVAAIVLIAALLPAGVSALGFGAEPEHAYGVIRVPDGPEGIVVLEERPAGVFVGVGLVRVPVRVISILGASAPCGSVGFSTVRLGTVHPVDGRFAAGWISGATDSVDAIASVRIMVGNELIACRTLVRGDRDGVSCDIDPDQPDCPRREYLFPGAGTFGTLLKLGYLPVVAERARPGVSSLGKVVAQILLVREMPMMRVRLADAPCDEVGNIITGFVIGGKPGVTVHLLGVKTVAQISAAWVVSSTGATRCIDLGLFQLGWG